MYPIDESKIREFFATSGSTIYNTIVETVESESMCHKIESGVLVGFSGGADSVMLLLFLIEYRRRTGIQFKILCSHINHCIRGDEADNDEMFCKSFCESLGIELIAEKYNVPEIANRDCQSLEEAARNVRYSAFNKIILGRNDIGCIAVAHNMSDSVETVIFNILRGSGAKGASGIRPIRDNIIRPLIGISKKDIHSGMDKFGIPYVTDSTNLSDDYTRNYIRHEVIPSFERITADPERMIARFADNIRSDEDFISSYVDNIFLTNKIITNRLLLSLHYSVYIRVLARMAEGVGASISHRIAEDVHSLLLKNNFSYSLIGKATFVCEQGKCRVTRSSAECIDFCFAIDEGVTDLSPFNAILVISKDKEINSYSNVYKNSIQANLLSAIIVGSLYLRPKKDGDTVYYGGMTHKVKKLFSDRKIPMSKRRLIPVLCDDKGVVWVPGFGVRDDGIPKDQREDKYVLLAINESSEGDRLYSASEFRT